MSVDLVLSILALLASFVSAGFTVATVRRTRQNLRDASTRLTDRRSEDRPDAAYISDDGVHFGDYR